MFLAGRTPGLADDVKRQRELIAFLRGRVTVAKRTNEGVLEATQELDGEQERLGELLGQQAERKRKREAQARSRLERSYRDSLIDAGAGIRNPNLVRGERGGRRVAELVKGPDARRRDNEAATREKLEELGQVYAAEIRAWTDMIRTQFSTFLGGTGAGNALQTHALEQFTLQGNRELSEQTGLLRRMAVGRSDRGGDEGLFA